MISDILSDAVSEIHGYLRDMPSVYAEVRPQIERLIAHMDSIRQQLDSPTGSPIPCPETAAISALRRIAYGPAFEPGCGDADPELYAIEQFAKAELKAMGITS